MDPTRDIHLILLALGSGLIDPARLAMVAREWPRHTPLLDFLTDRGWVTPEQWQRLEAEAAAGGKTADVAPGAVTAGGPSEATPFYNGPQSGRRTRSPSTSDRYHVTDLYRSGGLGRVWRAEDTALGRTVALKTLRPDRAGDPRLQARFVDEARITGQLEHPCIVPVYDLLTDGTTGAGGPCYTMRFVAGRTLAEAIRDYHDRRTAGRASRLDLAALLDAFVAVCRAVAYAHARNVLHRDLKGQNIVLGEYGEVFVLDWGLAKVFGGQDSGPAAITPAPTGPREETVTGSVLGTPAFMAPELAEGRPASPATDIYALGAVLYVILTGRPTYDGSGIEEVLDRVQAGPPPAPRTVNPDASPALEAVCLKAMARDPAARYPTADALAADVRRWLADEPVEAYPETWPARLARWARRHRAAVLGAAGILVTAVIALAVSTWLVWQEERRTAGEKDHARREWGRAEENLGRASDLSLALLDLTDAQLPLIRQDEAARRRMTAACLESFRQLLARRPDDPKVRQQTARAYRYAANLHRLLNETAAAERLYRESVAMLDALAVESPDEPTIREHLAGALRDQGRLFGRLGRLADAIAACRRSADLTDRLLAADPTRADRRRAVVNNLTDVTVYEYSRAKFGASVDSARQAANLIRPLVDGNQHPHPDDVMLLATALHRQAMALRELDQLPDSLAASHDALKQLDRLAAGDAAARHYRSRVLVEQAKVLLKLPDRLADADRDLGRAIDAWDGLQREARLAMYREWQAAAYDVRGRVRTELKQFSPAADDLDQSRQLLEGLIAGTNDVPAYQGMLGRTYRSLARLAAAQGNGPAAAAALAKARAAYQAAIAGAPENALTSRYLKEIADELNTAGEP